MIFVFALFALAYARTAEKTFKMKEFTGISVGSGADVVIVQSDRHEIVVKIDKENMEDVEIEQRGKYVEVGLNHRLFRRIDDFEVTVYMKDVTAIDLSGGTDAKLKGFKTLSKLRIELSGAADLYILSEMTINGDCEFDTSGGADLKVEAAVMVKGDIRLEASGGSDMVLKQLKAKNAKVDVSGGSDVFISLADGGSIRGEASGGSDIIVYGKDINYAVDTSGGSSVAVK